MEHKELKRCIARHSVTEERVDALTDGDKCFDLNGKPLDEQFAPDDSREGFKMLLKVCAVMTLLCAMFALYQR